MPRGDGTGPWGAGPMTGRAAGYCAGYPVPGYLNPAVGYGRGLRRGWVGGWGRGFGRGFGRRLFWRRVPAVAISPVVPPAYVPPVQQSPKQEIEALEHYQKQLEAEKADLEEEMDGVKARIEELKEKLSK